MNFNDSSSDEDDRDKYMKQKARGHSKTLASLAPREEYLYDEVYDDMKRAGSSTGTGTGAAGSTGNTDAPKYMDGLLRAKSQRELDRIAAREDRTRAAVAKDQHLYTGKAVYVSESYKKQQSEVAALREELQAHQDTGMTRSGQVAAQVAAHGVEPLDQRGASGAGAGSGHAANYNARNSSGNGANIDGTITVPTVPTVATTPTDRKYTSFLDLWHSTKIPPEELLTYRHRYRERTNINLT